MNSNKVIIYQLLPRLLHKALPTEAPGDDINQNGCGKLNGVSMHVLRSISALGATHVWFTGLIEHATMTDYSTYGINSSNPHVVKGQAGSPYAIRDYYDIDPDLATNVNRRMQEFMQLVRRTHQCGLKMIIDFVPNHVARQYHSDASPDGVTDLGTDDNQEVFFSAQNNFYYLPDSPLSSHSINLGDYYERPAKATGNDCFCATPGVNDWYETAKLNYGIDPRDGSRHFSPFPNTWHKMLHILLYWASKGVDGFRCDMAHMVPLEFWHWAIAQVKAQFPDTVFIAEIYDVSLYHDFVHQGGFDYLYDKVTLYDTLCAIMKGRAPVSSLTRCWQTVEGLQNHMLNFLENHDEMRLASPHHIGNVAHTLPAAVVSATISGCPFMVYAGQEFGEPAMGAQGFSGDDGRTSIFDYCSVPSLSRCLTHGRNGQHVSLAAMDAVQQSLHGFYRTLLNVCRSTPALGPDGRFFDLMYVNQDTLDADHQYAYLRANEDDLVIVVANFGNSPISAQVRVPKHAFDLLGIKSGTHEATELLAGQQSQFTLKADMCVSVPVKAHNAAIWEIKGGCGKCEK